MIRGIDAKAGSLTGPEIALYEGSLAIMVNDWVRNGKWNERRTEQLANELRSRGASA